MEILQASSQLASVGKRGKPQVRFLLAGRDRRQVTLDSGLVLKPDLAFAELPALDLLLLPAIWRNPLPVVRAERDWLALLGVFGMTFVIGTPLLAVLLETAVTLANAMIRLPLMRRLLFRGRNGTNRSN